MKFKIDQNLLVEFIPLLCQAGHNGKRESASEATKIYDRQH